MPVMGGLEATIEALKIRPELRILALTMLNEKTNFIEMTNAGVVGFVLKTSGKNEFERAIESITKGGNYFSNDLLRHIIHNNEHQANKDDKNREHLTTREKEVLQYLCEGFTVSEIASKLFISIKTIESHRSTLLRKTNTRNTINLVLYALRNKLVELS